MRCSSCSHTVNCSYSLLAYLSFDAALAGLEPLRGGTTHGAMCRRVTTFAAGQAGRRLALQHSHMVDGGAAAGEERRLVVGDAARLHNASSQIGGKRPLQGCEMLSLIHI